MRLTSIAFAILLAALLVSCDSGDETAPSQTLAELINGSSNLERFSVALRESGLESTLEGTGPFTVFAPSDDAFDTLFGDRGITVEDFLASDDLSEILAYHLVAAEISTPDLEDGDIFTTEQGDDLEARIDGGVISLIGAENTVRVTGQPLGASNGVLLVVDDVLLPEGVILQPRTSTVAGRVVNALLPTQPIEGALVTVVEAGATVETDADGEFDLSFAADSSGQPFTLQISKDGFETATSSFEAVLGGVVGAADYPLLPVDGMFTVIEPLMADQETVNFPAGESVTFTARFNMQVNWVLEIVGQESGAVKRIEGFSDELTDVNARWLGGTSELPLFRSEAVRAELVILNEDTDVLQTGLEVVVPREYEGDVITGFENDDEVNVVVRDFEFELDGASGPSMEVTAGEGDTFLLLRGTDDVVPNFFVGLAEITSTSGDGYFTVPTNAPEDLYLNAFIYGFGAGSENTIAILEIVVDGNGNGTFDDGADIIFGSGEIIPGGPGWTVFSRSAADFGLTPTQTQQIVAIRPILVSNNNTQPSPPLPVDFGLDYLTFTSGGPLQL